MLIARAGKPVANLSPVDGLWGAPKRSGFLAGQISVPDALDTTGVGEIETLFGAAG